MLLARPRRRRVSAIWTRLVTAQSCRPCISRATAATSWSEISMPISRSLRIISGFRRSRACRMRSVILPRASFSGSIPSPSMCIVPASNRAETSIPGMNRRSGVAAAAVRASASPDSVSWSVIAMAASPCRSAAATSCEGLIAPSEAVLCVCRSTKRRIASFCRHPPAGVSICSSSPTTMSAVACLYSAM